MDGIETERRFIIKMPPQELLDSLGGDIIEQIYITSEDGEGGATERVRARTHGERVTYTHTVKRRISAISSYEDECEISRGEFLRLSSAREDGTSAIRKTRYVLPFGGFAFEIDVYGAWQNVAVMEVELPDETAELRLPPQITVIKEVSGDRRLSNHSLARYFLTEDELFAEK